MLTSTIEAALNRQLNRELYSSYLYLAMSACCDASNLPGFGTWLRVQAKEELAHAMKFYDYIGDSGGRPVMDAIEAPPRDWAGARDAFAGVLAHEQAVTRMIGELMDLAVAEQDSATAAFLEWFVAEQVEEEENAGGILAQIEAIGDDDEKLLSLDRDLGARRG
jgi:ferritin